MPSDPIDARPPAPKGSHPEATLDDVDRGMLRDKRLMRDMGEAAQAHDRARRNEEVDWDAVIEDHIL